MKLRDFAKKSKVQKTSNQFIIQNETRDNKYKVQIDDLNKELGYYRHLEAERDAALGESARIQEKNVECEKSVSILTEEIQAARETIDSQQSVIEKLPVLEDELKDYKGQLGSKQNELEVMTKTAFDQSSKLSLLGQQIEGLQNENKQFTQETTQAKADKISAEEEAKAVLIKNIELQTSTMETSTINKELKKDCSTMRDGINFWEKEASEAQIQLEQAVQVESKLRKWITDLEQSGSEKTTLKGELDKKVNSLQNTMKDMSQVIEDLIKETSYLRDMNKVYRRELSKPRFLSMGSIAKREGFKMPTGKENIRTHNLGNSAPTLLKFRTEEKANAR